MNRCPHPLALPLIRSTRTLAPVLAGLLVLSPALAPAADAPPTGTRWEVTTSMNGMGISLPGQVTQVCSTGDHQDKPLPPQSKQNNCSYTQLSQTGNSAKYAIKCGGDHPMEGTGEMTYSSDHYTGKFNLNAGPQGQMAMTFEGRKMGTCTGTEANNPAKVNAMKQQAAAGQAQYQQAMAQSCKLQAEGGVRPYPFMDALNTGTVQCPDPALKQQYCTHFQTYKPFVGQKDSEAQTRAAGVTGTVMATPFTDSLKLCGVTADTVQTQLCSSAESDGEMEFLVKECPVQTQAIAARECAGRSYTSVSAKYRGLCSNYATANAKATPGNSAPGTADSPSSLKDKAKSAFKGLFGH
ncbi:MAG TPA: DUF3617 family protein [Steroidobacteraceae bacterium]|jgi:hypothetical protein